MYTSLVLWLTIAQFIYLVFSASLSSILVIFYFLSGRTGFTSFQFLAFWLSSATSYCLLVPYLVIFPIHSCSVFLWSLFYTSLFLWLQTFSCQYLLNIVAIPELFSELYLFSDNELIVFHYHRSWQISFLGGAGMYSYLTL